MMIKAQFVCKIILAIMSCTFARTQSLITSPYLFDLIMRAHRARTTDQLLETSVFFRRNGRI